MKYTLQTDRAFYESVSESTNRVYVWASEYAAQLAHGIEANEDGVLEKFSEADDLPGYVRAHVRDLDQTKPKPLIDFSTYDYATGRSTIETQEDFDRACREWEDGLDEDEFQKYFENN